MTMIEMGLRIRTPSLFLNDVSSSKVKISQHTKVCFLGSGGGDDGGGVCVCVGGGQNKVAY